MLLLLLMMMMIPAAITCHDLLVIGQTILTGSIAGGVVVYSAWGVPVLLLLLLCCGGDHTLPCVYCVVCLIVGETETGGLGAKPATLGHTKK